VAEADCIFCRIVAGEAPAHRVREDERTLTFLDLFPVGRGHLLVVPKRHGENIFEVAAEDLQAVMGVSQRMAFALRRSLAPDGIGIHQLNGAAAGQTVFHYHMHLIPRHMGDPPVLHGRVQGDDAELARTCAEIRAALGE